jgi:glucose/arabinose dehydrogenase
LLVVRDGTVLAQPAWEAPPHPASGNGLQFIVLHPRFAENHLVYFSYPKYDGARGNTLAVARGAFTGTALENVKTSWWRTRGNGRQHGWARVLRSRWTLLVTVGDRDRRCCDNSEDNSLRMKAQDLSNHVGKTLRIRDDGTIPPDNPFVGRQARSPRSTPTGTATGTGSRSTRRRMSCGRPRSGPLGGDEVNILQPGHNYGWPLVSTGRNYTGTEVSDQPWFRPGMDNPRMFWVPSISPSSLLFYDGDRFKGWKGSMFVGSLTQRELIPRILRAAVAGRTARDGFSPHWDSASGTCSLVPTATCT